MASLWAIIKLLPEVIGLIKSLIKTIDRGIEIHAIKAKLKDLSGAIDYANETKSTARLERLFNAGSLHKRK